MNQGKTLTHARYVLGSIVSLIGVISVTKYLVFGIMLFISGMLLFPDIFEYIEEITKRKINLYIRILLPLVFFVTAICLFNINTGISFDNSNSNHLAITVEKMDEYNYENTEYNTCNM